MVRFLPFIIIIVVVLILGGLGYWRFTSLQTNKQTLTTAQVATENKSVESVEVPRTLPALNLEDRVETLEKVMVKLSPNQFPQASSVPGDTSLNSRVMVLESVVADLKAKVTALEKTTPVTSTTTSSKPAVYIPFGSPITTSDQNGIILDEYKITIDTADYPGYTNMVLEASMRLNWSSGTAQANLYNVTDGVDIANSQVSTTSDKFNMASSANFTLPAGKKTYTIKAKSPTGTLMFLDWARIKVNF